MKKVLLGLSVVTLVSMFLVGCELFATETTYSYTVSGICVEITTSDQDMKDAAEAAGYTEGECSTTGIIGTCGDYASVGGSSYDAVFYESTYTESTAELTCSFIGGNWVSQ